MGKLKRFLFHTSDMRLRIWFFLYFFSFFAAIENVKCYLMHDIYCSRYEHFYSSPLSFLQAFLAGLVIRNIFFKNIYFVVNFGFRLRSIP